MNMIHAPAVARFTLRLSLSCLALVLTLSMHAKTSLPSLPAPSPDHRHQKLEIFFQSFKCPAPLYVQEYLAAADIYAIDYRLLPVISVLESTCGVHQRLNNRWGWNSARSGFTSVRAGLDYIARKLAHGHYYKDKSVVEKVRMYNPNPDYLKQVIKLMKKIDNQESALLHDVALPSVLSPSAN